MKKLIATLTFILALVVTEPAIQQPVQAQSTTTQTVLSAAVTQNSNTLTVASTTGFIASTQSQEYDIWVDGELMKVNTINTTTNVIGVTRGRAPTKGSAHATGSVVFFGIVGNTISTGGTSPFTNQSLPPGTSCVRTSFVFLPIINVADGTLTNCLATGNGGSRWVSYNFRQWAYGHPVTNVIDVAYTATLADEFINYASLTATRILTLPGITGVVGKTIIVTTGGTGTSAITITPVFNQFFGAGAATTISQTNAGSVTRLISVINATGAYVWQTW